VELLKYTQQIQDIYEALNLIYNGDTKEDYAGAYNILKVNPLTNEFVPREVFKFITDCAETQIKMQNILMINETYTHVTNINGRYNDDVNAYEIGEGAIYPDQRVPAYRGARVSRIIFDEEYTAEWTPTE
jgi:hypothetical protein